jgi:outer membrane protein OmpA-like peptidoglycan-associated protein
MKYLAFILWVLIQSPLQAQPMKAASVEQMVEQLSAPEQPKTRSLRNLRPEPRNLDLVIQFDFDSAKLLETSKPLLDNLVHAMQAQRLANVRFSVEGHTDAKGTEIYNMHLSSRRADAVATYLIEKGISKDRLESVGKGFSELLYPERPQSMENRRVRITTLP